MAKSKRSIYLYYFYLIKEFLKLSSFLLVALAIFIYLFISFLLKLKKLRWLLLQFLWH